MNSFWMIGAAAMAVGLVACEQQSAPGAKPDPAAAASAVEQVEQEMLAAFQAKDAAKLTSYYAPDGVLATPGRAAIKGNAAIAKANSKDLADPNFKLSFANDKTEAAASGELAYTMGTYDVTYTDPKTKQPENGSGNYVTIFKKQADGSWKAAADFVVPGG